MSPLGEWFWLIQAGLCGISCLAPSRIASAWRRNSGAQLPEEIKTGNFEADFRANKHRRDIENAYWESGLRAGYIIVAIFWFFVIFILPVLVFGWGVYARQEIYYD